MTGSRNPMEDSHRDATALIRAAVQKDYEAATIIVRHTPDAGRLCIMLAMMMAAELNSIMEATGGPEVMQALDVYQAAIRQRLAEETP